jgi:hypothetical protein
MDVSRAEKISEVMKNITGLGKNIKKPSTLRFAIPGQASNQSRLPEPVAGSQTIRIIMIVIASLLLVGILLLGIDQWITPIFQRAPGDNGFIPVPGIDPSELYWPNVKQVSDITIGTLVPDALGKKPLSTMLIENQANYSITMDVYITNEYPQELGLDTSGKPINERTFFLIGSSIMNPVLRVSINNQSNTIIITSFYSNGLRQSIEIDNVPIHKPFRIGIVNSPHIMEGYLNGLLVKTLQLKSTTVLPQMGDKIYSPENIKINNVILSRGIKLLNIRLFGYTVPSSEMKGRMTDGLTDSRLDIWKV